MFMDYGDDKIDEQNVDMGNYYIIGQYGSGVLLHTVFLSIVSLLAFTSWGAFVDTIFPWTA